MRNRRTATRTLSCLALCLLAMTPLQAEDASHPPRVVVAWAAGPLEARIAWDRALDPSTASGAVGRRIVVNENSPTAKRKGPAAEPGGALNIAAARLEDEGRTLVLTTDPHARVATYSLELPGVKGRGEPGAGATVNLAYDLTGVGVTWDDGKDEAKPSWSGWWPGLDNREARQKTRGSAEHDRGFALADRPGRLTLSTLLRLKGKGTLHLSASGPFETVMSGEEAKSKPGADGSHELSLTQDWTGDLIDLTLTLHTGTTGKPPFVHATDKDASRPGRSSPLAPGTEFVPWAPPLSAPPGPLPALPDLTGGDRAKGEAIFFGDAAKCATCHKFRGKGGAVGPDLSEQFRRERPWVYRDIAEPSAVIHPDFVQYTVALKNGQVLAGIVRAEGAGALRVTNSDAKSQTVPRAEVEELRPSATSIMPVGLVGALGEASMRDLMTFLTSPLVDNPKN